MNIKKELESMSGKIDRMQFSNVDIQPEKIRAVMINEVVPADSEQDFYGGGRTAYLETTIPLFQKAECSKSSKIRICNKSGPD